MNPYEQNGINFLNKIDYLVRRKDLKTKNSLFKVLDNIRLKEEFNISLYTARQAGLGDESFFYTYWRKIPTHLMFYEDQNYPWGPHNKGKDMFKDLVVEPTAMGAWQAYLLMISPTVLPVFWHGGYIRRKYFFDREHFECPPTMWEERPINLSLEMIPQPTVSMEDNKAVVSCPYWNDWEGLVLESTPIIFKASDRVSILRAKHKVLYKYDCGICF